MIRRLYLTIALLFFFSSTSMATGYIGFGFGSVDFGADAISSFDDPTGFELIAGKEINRNISFEFSYLDFGEANDGVAPVWRLSGDALTAGALIRAKAGQTADVFLKVGMFSWDLELTQDGFGTIGTDDGTDIFYGFGVMVKMSDSVGIGARYNSYDLDGDDVTMFSINAQLSF